MELQQLDLIKKYLNLLAAGHKWIVGCILLAISAGLAFYINTPEVYQSSASIVYQRQHVNPSKFSPDQEIGVSEMLNTVSQQVMSRSNLEVMIEEFDLYPEARKKAPIEDVIEKMRQKDITLERQGDGNVFSISFRGRQPRTVRAVTNELAAKFIEENLRARQEQAREVAEYIQDELRMSKEVLHKKEGQMRDYKLKYYNEMPQQREANMNRLNVLQEQLRSVESNIQSLEQTRLLVAEQLEVLQNLRAGAAAAAGGDSETVAVGPEAELAEARSRLQDLRAKYTDAHPAVARMEKKVGQLESQVADIGSSSGPGPSERKAAMAGSESREARIQELTYQLKEIEMDLQALRKESKETRSQIEQYQAWIDAAPVREAEWAELTRDYTEIKEYHDKLVSQSLGAEAAKSLEVSQKGSQFRVVDPAFLPNSPLKGTFLKVLLISVLGGIAVGSGLILGLDFMDTSFKGLREIEETLNMSVVCAMPLVVTDAEQKRSKIINIFWYIGYVFWLCAWIAATFYFWNRGDIILTSGF
ncbi:MAG: Wzz/FepE/Etk N-terminal domain-containing protein [Desulfosalsimonadaceae bacterium]